MSHRHLTQELTDRWKTEMVFGRGLCEQLYGPSVCAQGYLDGTIILVLMSYM